MQGAFRTSKWALLVPLAFLLAGGTALAWQEDSNAAAAGGAIFAGMFLFVFLVFALAMYLYTALCLQTIARKTNTADSWLAWIPIANLILMLKIARKPLWWILLCLIPLVNVVIMVIVWMEIAKARNKPQWWGILMLVPVANLIAPGYLAFAD